MSRLVVNKGAAESVGRMARAFSLVEVSACVLIVAVMFVAVMYTVGAARMTQYKTDGRSRAARLAHDLMAEILQQHYEEPDGPGAIGPDTSEAFSRANFDDVDDYDAWFASPPQRKDGTTITLPAGWSRKVKVRWTDPNNFLQTELVESNAKRITVTVKHNNVKMAEVTAVRTRAFPRIER